MSRMVGATAFVVLWSSGFVGAVLAQPAGSVAGVLAWRYLVTAVLLSTTVLDSRLAARRAPISWRDVLQQGVLGLLAHVVFLGGVFGASAGGVSAGTVALVCAVQPMLVTVAGRVGWGDVVTRRQVVGLVVGLGAVVATVGADTGVSGALLTLPVLSLCGLSGAALLERRWRPDLDLASSLGIQVTLSAAVFLGYAAWSGRLSIPLDRDTVGALAWLVLLSGLGGYASFVWCLRSLGSTTTSLLLYLTPPVTTIWAWAMSSRPLPSDSGSVSAWARWP